MAEQPSDSAAPVTPRPTLADHQAWKAFQSTTLTRALDDAKAWRNGYAMLAGGVGAVLGLIGDRLGNSTPWNWRLALSLTFGPALVLTAIALWMVLTIEGGYRARTVNLRDIVKVHNSFEMYQADQAASAIKRLGRSRWLAVAASILAFAGLMITLWMPSTADAASSAAPVPATSMTPTVVSTIPTPTPVPTGGLPTASPTK